MRSSFNYFVSSKESKFCVRFIFVTRDGAKASIFHSWWLEEELRFVETDEITDLVVRKYAVPCREFRRFRVVYLFEWVVRSGKWIETAEAILWNRIFFGKKINYLLVYYFVYVFVRQKTSNHGMFLLPDWYLDVNCSRRALFSQHSERTEDLKLENSCVGVFLS